MMGKGITSMTGYGRSQADCPAGRVTIEVRSLNHRFLEVSYRAPREFLFLDPEIRRLTRERAERGKVEIFLTFDRPPDRPLLDESAARALIQQLGSLAALVGDKPGLDDLLAAASIWVTPAMVAKETYKCALSAAAEALDRMALRRREEGERLASDVRSRIGLLRGIRERMLLPASAVPERIMRQVRDFLERAQAEELAPGRLEAEVALLAQRADITEELTRLVSHLDAMDQAMEGGAAAGRKMDFLLQEAGREINTIGSKANDAGLSALVVEGKSEMEKIREQVQNIE